MDREAFSLVGPCPACGDHGLHLITSRRTVNTDRSVFRPDPDGPDQDYVELSAWNSPTPIRAYPTNGHWVTIPGPDIDVADRECITCHHRWEETLSSAALAKVAS